MANSPRKRSGRTSNANDDERKSRALNALTATAEEGDSGASTAAAAAPVASSVSRQEVVVKPNIRQFKFNESLNPRQWFADWEHRFMIVCANDGGGGVTDQHKIACMINSLTLRQKQRLEFERKEDTTLEEFKRAFNKAFTRSVEEENSIIFRDDILEDPLSIKDNIKEEDKN